MDSRELDQLVLGSLQAFASALAEREWRGRENELVSLFAFGFLAPRACAPAGPLDRTQLGIEVAVPQLSDWGANPKADVRKDLVIWRTPWTTNWTPSATPASRALAVLEWKSINNIGVAENAKAKRRGHLQDIDWLTRSTASQQEFTGYAILVDLKTPPVTISCTTVRAGAIVGRPREFRGASG